MAFEAAEFIPAGIGCDVVKPGLKVTTPELLDALPCREKDFLGGVFCCLDVAQHAQGEVIYLALIYLNQLIETVEVTLLTTAEKLFLVYVISS